MFAAAGRLGKLIRAKMNYAPKNIVHSQLFAEPSFAFGRLQLITAYRHGSR